MSHANYELVVASQYGPSASSTRVRIYDWLKYFNIEPSSQFEYMGSNSNSPLALSKNLKGTIKAEIARKQLVSGVRDSIVFLSRELSPLSLGFNEHRLLKRAKLGVYDFDDALYSRFPGLFGRIYSRKRVWQKSVAAADVVIAGSQILAEHASLHNDNVVMIPSCVNPTDYVQKGNFEIGETPLAVWIGSPSTERYLLSIQSALLKAHKETGLRVKVISSGNKSLGSLDDIVDRFEWSASSFAIELAEADFGIMPLTDDIWSAGKCAYKLLQYGASRLPVIASPIGSNKDALTVMNGFSAASINEWSTALTALCNMSSTGRERLGEDALKGVRENFSFQAWDKVWLKAVFGSVEGS